MYQAKITTERPPVYDQIKEQFGVEYDEGKVAVTYGDTIHIKTGRLSEDLKTHELVHVKQQTEYEGGAKAWWKKYLQDPKFRISQEIEAYRKQYGWIVQNVKSRNERFKHLRFFAECLSGPMYGNEISFMEAIHEIRKG